MSRRTLFGFALCGLVAVLNVSCYYSQSSPVMTETEAIPAAQTQLGPADPVAGTESLQSPQSAAASENGKNESPSDAIDAEEVLKSALARAADEEKRVLVHLGAPG
jgi:hypothetical protein